MKNTRKILNESKCILLFLILLMILFSCNSRKKKQVSIVNNVIIVEQKTEEKQNTAASNNEIVTGTGHTYSSVIRDEEIYDFLNWMTINEENDIKYVYYGISKWYMENFILKDENTLKKNKNFFLKLIRKTNIVVFLGSDYIYDIKSGTDTIFKKEDRDFLFLQFNSIKDTIWHDNFSQSELTQKALNAHFYSIPLFSLDRNYVIISKEYYCGSECAYGGIFVYRRINENIWVFVTSVVTWVS